MPIANLDRMLRRARAENYAVAQFNVDTIEIAQAVLGVAEALHSPVILAIGQGVDHAGRMEPLAAGLRALIDAATVPVCLHLDHSERLPQIAQALRSGFSGIMIDGSARPLADNIAITRTVLDLCSAMQVGVEAELGRIGGVEDGIEVDASEAEDVSVDLVKEFLKGVRPDALAVAVGTAHGFYASEPKVDFNLIEALRAEDTPPLVLHGGTGLPDQVLSRAVRAGICKMNFATELRHAFVQGVQASPLQDSSIFDVLKAGAQASAKVARAKIHLMGSVGKAD